jgi:hypothetical protein
MLFVNFSQNIKLLGIKSFIFFTCLEQACHVVLTLAFMAGSYFEPKASLIEELLI